MGDKMAVNPEIIEALTDGIQSEIATYVFYLEVIKIVKDDKMIPVLENLAMEEKKHFQILERQHDSLIRSEKWVSTADILRQEGLPEISKEMQDKHKDLIARVKILKTTREILNMALELEIEARDLFIKFEDMAESDEGKKTFERLAGFEEGHAKLIRNMIQNLKD